ATMARELLETHFRIAEALTKPAGAKREHVRLIHGDALAGKNTLNHGLVQAVRELLGTSPAKRAQAVADLPYAIPVPLMSDPLVPDLPVERMVGRIQWELAERLMAAPGTKDYGSLAVLVQSLATVELVRKVPPTVFFPRPQVDSAIVLIRPDPAKRAQV